MALLRVAAVQTAPVLVEPEKNLEDVRSALKDSDAGLTVFPECTLTGYGYDSKEAAMKLAEPIPGPSTKALVEACRKPGSWAVVGLLERDGDKLYNSAVLAGPEGIAGKYRKMHLPFLGVDRFVDPGDLGFPVFDTPIGKIGLLICYDGSFPEAVRALKLGGAQLVCLPTNWPEAAEISMRYSPMMRSQENHVNFVACNRVGEETGFRFPGGSKICDYTGRILAECGASSERASAELDLASADNNRVVNVPGEYELDRIAHRRPEHYGRLVEGG